MTPRKLAAGFREKSSEMSFSGDESRLIIHPLLKALILKLQNTSNISTFFLLHSPFPGLLLLGPESLRENFPDLLTDPLPLGSRV